MAKNIERSSDFAQNVCNLGSQQEIVHLFVEILLHGTLESLTSWKDTEYVHFSRAISFCSEMTLDCQNASV